MIDAVTRGDLAILDFMQAHLSCGFLDTVMPALTRLGDSGVIWIVLAAALLLFPRTRKYGLAAALALVIGALLCNVTLKPLVARLRPFEIADTMRQLLIDPPSDFSFPSGHTKSSFAAATALAAARARGGLAAMILAAVIAFSRLYLYVHYPTDVIAGALIGAFSGLAAYALVWNPRKKERKHTL